MEIYKYPAIVLRDQFLQGKLSAEEIVKYFLRRIEKNDGKTSAFLKVFPEQALKKAKELDQKRSQKKYLGKLAAIPVAIKDNMHIKGEITTCGSKFLENYRAPFSASAIRFLEQEDAIFIGKTNLDEFAMGSSNENSAFYPSYNPWHLECSPGGSSGGSSAAVAARLVPLATGSDTGGSIRQPAAFCGIVGFKPTYGRISRFGLVAFGSSLDQIGPLTTNVRDAGLAMEVMGRHCEKDATSLEFPPETYLERLPDSLQGVRVGVPWHFLEQLHKDCHDNFLASIEVLKQLGAEIIDIDLDVLKYSIAIYYIIATAEASTNLARFDGVRYGVRADTKTLDELYDMSREMGFGYEVKKRILLGTFVLSSGYQEAYYKQSQKIRTLIIKAYEKAFELCDCICMPTTPITTFPLGTFQDPIKMYLQDIFTIPSNLAGLPTISVPSGFDALQKPFGLQFIGPQMHDVYIIQYAHAFEKSTGYGMNIPPEFDKEF